MRRSEGRRRRWSASDGAVGKIGRANEFPLVAGQPFLLFQALDRDVLLRRSPGRECARNAKGHGLSICWTPVPR